jgi:TolA-binding protein
MEMWLRRTLVLLAMVTDGLGPSQEVPNGLILAGECHERRGEYADARAAYQRAVDEYPGYDRAWYALYKVGQVSEVMGDKQLVPKETALASARTAYTKVVADYGKSPGARLARRWLTMHAE